jgi:hypothetical protein
MCLDSPTKLQNVLEQIEEQEMEITVICWRTVSIMAWNNNFGSNYHVRFKNLCCWSPYLSHQNKPRQPFMAQVARGKGGKT